ncbi:regulatory protein RecX [Celerinatantimonas sp. YJH-8]|uniref:regulatory protein RecX n=1 Tax=Celerinatantimonas sp. YJH-8 TaxID=3228714 RepID=UPI0038C40974
MVQSKLTAKGAMMELLSRRSYSRARLAQKLLEKEYSLESVEEALAVAENYGWIDDKTYALGLIRSRISSGYGPAYIRQYLVSKGVERSVADRALQQDDWDWWQAIDHAFYKKYRELPGDWQLKRKCSAFLYRRGFDSDLIQSFMQHLQSGEND